MNTATVCSRSERHAATGIIVPQPAEFRNIIRLRRWPVGAEVMPEGGVDFRVWAPHSTSVNLEIYRDIYAKEPSETTAMTAEAEGYFCLLAPQARPGTFYRYRLDSGAYPDPASRFQPAGPHGPSEVVDPSTFAWTDGAWGGVRREGQVLYEMHIGTFTTEGNWAAAQAQLPVLKDLGITVIELMPVADFPGRFGWGYDGVNLYAPTRLYGRPDELRAFINRAHEIGLGVILDVVYNHLGPDGNYLKHFAPAYFTDRYVNEWGEAINFDGEDSGPVREFFIANAGYWIDEYHFDGLRLDATQQIFDASEENVMLAITRKVREMARGRAAYIVGENEPQHPRLVRPAEQGGYEIDALWNDDFHHAVKVALTGRNEAYYMDYKGSPQEFISVAKYGYLYQGQRYAWQKKRRGKPTTGVHPAQFITYIQNHDQIANSLRGIRIHELTSPGRYRALTTLLLLGPATPMLFQGQEFAASTHFYYFADHNPELAKLVAKGRTEFLSQFPSIANPECQRTLAQPEGEDTFMRCKLDFSEREKHAGIYQFHRDLLRLRREDPVFKSPRPGGVDGAVLGREAFVLRFFGEQHADRLLLINLGMDLALHVVPEPLLAPPEGARWEVIWSSEEPRYGGCGIPPVETEEDGWHIPGQTAVVLAAIAEESHG